MVATYRTFFYLSAAVSMEHCIIEYVRPYDVYHTFIGIYCNFCGKTRSIVPSMRNSFIESRRNIITANPYCTSRAFGPESKRRVGPDVLFKMQPVLHTEPVENCETCGQSCDSPITVLKGKRRLYFCSGDCEAMHEAQEHK